MKLNNLPDFTERFKPPVTHLVEEDRNKPFTPENLFIQQLKVLNELIAAVRSNVQPEFDPTFAVKQSVIATNVTQITYETRMFQYVIVNPSSAVLQIGFGEGGNVNLPYRYDVPSNRVFISPVAFFSGLTFNYATTPTPQALAFCYAYNRILHTPGMYSLT